jgi:hypothetical protein
MVQLSGARKLSDVEEVVSNYRTTVVKDKRSRTGIYQVLRASTGPVGVSHRPDILLSFTSLDVDD